MYRVIFSKKAVKSLAKIPKDYQLKVRAITSKLEKDPFVLDLKKLSENSSKATHRLRFGSYRIFLKINGQAKEIILAKIERRTTQTYH